MLYNYCIIFIASLLWLTYCYKISLYLVIYLMWMYFSDIRKTQVFSYFCLYNILVFILYFQSICIFKYKIGIPYKINSFVVFWLVSWSIFCCIVFLVMLNVPWYNWIYVCHLKPSFSCHFCFFISLLLLSFILSKCFYVAT